MQRLEVSGAVRPIYGSLGVKRLIFIPHKLYSKNKKLTIIFNYVCHSILYRMSIKSFPDYKHLLQENYVEYKHTVYFRI